MENLFYQYNPWWENEDFLKKVHVRPKYMEKLRKHLKNKHIIFLTGLRRVGKTTLMKLMIKHLISDNGVDPRHILYLSLDDYVLAKDPLYEILIKYRNIHRIGSDEKIYLFLDEVIYKDDIHQQLKNIHDSQNSKIYASASSSVKLRDTKAFLTGRSYTVDIGPLDFSEYLQFIGKEIKKKDMNLLGTYFEEYMQTGGLPYYVLTRERDYLVETVDDILHKDIIAEHNIRNHQVIKDMFMLIMERSGKQLSVYKLAKILKRPIDSIKRYMSHFENTFLVYCMPRYGTTNEKIMSAKKVYAGDLGIKYAYTGMRDLGSFFENYVYLQIRGLKPYYLYQDGLEIDFLIDKKAIIEVKYNAEMSSKQKEMFDNYNIPDKYLLDSVESLQKIRVFLGKE